MPSQTIHFRGNRAQLRRELVGLVRAATGRAPDPTGLAKGVQLRVGVTALSLIQQAFIVKSRGGTGSDGITWKPLKRETIAQRRTSGAERKALGITGKRVRGLLTPTEDRVWRGIFASVVARLRVMGVPGAEGIAARIAWAKLKSMGAKTKLDVLGGRQVDIGRDTGVMFRSLTPGVDARPSGAPHQVFETPTGAVIVGTNLPYAARFHKDRRLWPEDGLPPRWWAAIHASAVRGLFEAAKVVLSQGGRG